MLLRNFNGRKALFDVECSPNYVTLSFEDVDTGTVSRFRIDPDNNKDERQQAEEHYRQQAVIIAYNSHGYDDHILAAAFSGSSCYDIFKIGDDIITNRKAGGRRLYSPFLTRGGEPRDGYPLSIDLAAIITVRSRFPGLKKLGIRFGYPHLQELPYKPGTVLNDEQKHQIDLYNNHDLTVTRLVLAHLDDAIEMRRALGELYHCNLTSHTDARLGETIIINSLTRTMNEKIAAEWQDDCEPEWYRLNAPKQNEWICGGSDIISKRHVFKNPNLVALLDKAKAQTLRWKRSRDAEHKLQMATPSFETKVVVDDKTYKYGMGGLHSEDSPGIWNASDTHGLKDIDFTSYYPSVMITERIAPSHIDIDLFCKVYAELLAKRIAAKEQDIKAIAAGLKIALNAVFGKLGDVFSKLCDPTKHAQVTFNGQFTLLRMIEAMTEIDGVKVLSANTDGILIHYPREKEADIQAAMEKIAKIYDTSGFDDIEVLRVCRSNVSEYVLSYHDPKSGQVKMKAKGAKFNDQLEAVDLSKKTDRRIIKKAAIDRLLFDVPIDHTIRSCRDITEFVCYESLDDTWSHIEDDSGNRIEQETNRWYESTKGIVLWKINAKTGKRNRFAKLKSAVIVNDFPAQFPDDLNYDYYIAEAEATVTEILNPKQKKTRKNKTFDKLSDEELDELSGLQNAEEPDLEFLTGEDFSILMNHYRDLYLNRFVISTYNSMQAILTMLWKDNTLSLTRADILWCLNSLDSDLKYFARREKYKSIISYIEWMIANVVPFDKEVFPDDDATIPVTVNVLGNEPGGGKTRDAIRKIVRNGPDVYWWAIDKIDPIASERYAELKQHADAAGVSINFEAIHSKAEGKGTMKMRIDKRMHEINKDENKEQTIYVSIITHATLIAHYLADVSGVLLIDEPAQVWEQRRFNFKASYRTIREVIEPKNAAADYDGDVNHVIDADTQAVRFILTDTGKEEVLQEEKKNDTVFGSYRWILEQSHKTSGRVFALAEEWNALENPDAEGNLHVIALLHPLHVAHFDECWMMAAHFKELLIYDMWNDLYDVEWIFHEITDGWQRKVPLNERVTIYYILENRMISDTYLDNKGNPSRQIAMAQAVKGFYGDDPYIWTTNQRYKDSGSYNCLPLDVIGADGERHDAYLTPKANGINCYQNLHGAAWLASIKLSENLLKILSRVWGNTEARVKVLREYELYSCLQFLARGNSRRFDSYAEVRYIVADYVQAEYMKEMWNLPDKRVLPLPMDDKIKLALDDVKSKGKGRKPSMNPDQKRKKDAERKRKVRAKKAEAKGNRPGRTGRPRKGQNGKM